MFSLSGINSRNGFYGVYSQLWNIRQRTGLQELLVIFFSLYHQYLNHQAEPYARISRKHGSGIKNAGIEIGGLRERREL